MGILVWVSASFNNTVCDELVADLRALEYFEVPYEFGDDAYVYSEGYYVGWISYQELIDLHEKVDELLRRYAVAARVEIEYTECDDPGKEIEYWGRNAHLLEIQDLEIEAARIAARLLELRNKPTE